MEQRALFAVWIGLAVLVGVSAFLVGGRSSGPSTAPYEVVAATVAGSGTITVHVAGAVAEPGLVSLPPGSRVADAIAGAGGATAIADLGAVNLAEPIDDAGQVVVPVVGEGGAPAGDGRVRINSATAEELATLPGIGPVLAQRIVDHRDEVGRFEAVEDLLDVSGIGERLLAGMREQIVLP